MSPPLFPSRLKIRLVYLTLLMITVALGLLSRRFPDETPSWIHLYAGDTLWSLMVYWILRLSFPENKTPTSALAALLFSFAIELSQICHTPWLDAIRATRLGGLVLGFGFLWSDLICYTTGVAVGILSDKFLIQNRKAIHPL